MEKAHEGLKRIQELIAKNDARFVVYWLHMRENKCICGVFQWY